MSSQLQTVQRRFDQRVEELEKLRREHDNLQKKYADEIETGKRRSMQSMEDKNNLEAKLTKAG